MYDMYLRGKKQVEDRRKLILTMVNFSEDKVRCGSIYGQTDEGRSHHEAIWLVFNLWQVYFLQMLRWMYAGSYRMRTTENMFMIGAAVFIGVVAGFSAIGFRWLIEFIQTLSHPDWGGTLEAIMAVPWYYKLLIPAIGGALIGPLVYFGAREAKGHGVPEVMEAVAMRGGPNSSPCGPGEIAGISSHHRYRYVGNPGGADCTDRGGHRFNPGASIQS